MSQEGAGTKAARLVVSGRVQGVWFRAHTENKAREFGLLGTVRNLPDGTVEIVAEGSAAAIAGLREWAWQGSPHSRVTAVEIEDLEPSGEFESFTTRY